MQVIIQIPLPGTDMIARYKNIYCQVDGTLRPTPFEMPKEGMWYFDGQFFYQRSNND